MHSLRLENSLVIEWKICHQFFQRNLIKIGTLHFLSVFDVEQTPKLGTNKIPIISVLDTVIGF